MEPGSFHFAASRGDVGLVRELIAFGNNVNAVDPDGATALHLAISSGRGSVVISEIVGLLLEAGASLDIRDHEGRAALHIAAANGCVQSVDLLIRAGADVNSEVSSGGVTSLFLAINHDRPDNDRTEVIRLLIEAGASLEKQDANGFSPLRKAVALGKVNVVRQLILSGADVNEVNESGKSILLAAARSQRNDEDVSQIIEMLLTAGALPNIPDFQGFTPLHAAATLGNARRVDQLIRAGADVNSIDQSRNTTILHSVIESVESDEDRFEVVRLLLEAEISFDRLDSRGYNALQFATVLEKVDTVEQLILAGSNVNLPSSCLHLVAKWKANGVDYSAIIRSIIDAGAEINARDSCQRTALHNAAESGNVHIFKQLVESGADVNAQDSCGLTALSVAIIHCTESKNLLEMIRALRRGGVSVPTYTNYGKPLLHIAIARGHIEVVEELISAGIDVQAVESNGSTCLHVAVLCAKNYVTNFSRIVNILLDAGAALNEWDSRQRTPLHIAVSQGYAEWVECLVEAGADAKAIDSFGRTSLYRAIYLGKSDERLRIIRSLTRASASVVDHSTCKVPLESAVEKGDLLPIELKLLLQAYLDERPNLEISMRLESIGAYEDTINHRLEIIRLSLMADILLYKRLTPLHYAAISGDVALVEHLIIEGADVNAVTNCLETSLHLALRSDSDITTCRQIVQSLLRANALVNVLDSNGRTPLKNSLKFNDEEIVQQLIMAGADPGIIDNAGSSCLHDAVLLGCRDPSRVIAILIEAGAPVHVTDGRHHRTPLHYAVLWGYVEAVHLLIEAGVDVDVADDCGLTCLHWASQANGYSQYLQSDKFDIDHPIHTAIRLLLEAGANPDAGDTHGITPLMCAANVDDPRFVEQLIEAGADVNIANTRDSCTALDWVCRDLYPSVLKDSTCRIVSLLVAAGAEATQPVDYTPARLNGRPRNAHDHYLDCRRDLQFMRETVFYASITYYQIYKENSVSKYVRNESVVEKFDRGEFTALFPTYGKDLEQAFRAAKAKRDLMDRAGNGLQRILGFYYDFIHDQILEYLHDEDLQNLCSV